MKYILTLSFISSIFCSICFLNYINNIRQYFIYGTISHDVINLDHILSQIPEINYNGSEISLDDEEPIYINNIDNQPIAVIDAGNKLSPTLKAKIPILFTSKNIILSFKGSSKEATSSFAFEYWQVLGRKSLLLSQEVLRAELEKKFSAAPRVVIYLAFPIMAFIIFFNMLLERSFFIIMLYLMTNFFISTPTSLKTCTRLTMFASGVFVLLEPIPILIAPQFSWTIWVVQIWANLLMILAILKLSKKTLFMGKK